MVSRTHAAARATRSKALQCCTVRKLFILCFKSRPCHGLSHTCCSEGDTIKSPAMLYSSKTFYIMFQVAPMPWSLAHMLQRGRHDQKPCNAVQFEKPLLRRCRRRSSSSSLQPRGPPLRRSRKCASGHFSERKCMCFYCFAISAVVCDNHPRRAPSFSAVLFLAEAQMAKQKPILFTKSARL